MYAVMDFWTLTDFVPVTCFDSTRYISSLQSCWNIKFCGLDLMWIVYDMIHRNPKLNKYINPILPNPNPHSLMRERRSDNSSQCGSSIGWQVLLEFKSSSCHLRMEGLQVSLHLFLPFFCSYTRGLISVSFYLLYGWHLGFLQIAIQILTIFVQFGTLIYPKGDKKVKGFQWVKNVPKITGRL